MKNDNDTEFIRPHFIDAKKELIVKEIQHVPEKYNKKDIRMTLDYIEDFYFFEAVIGHFKKENIKMTFDGILELLKERPSLVKINWFREQEWKENQTKMINRIVL